MHILIDKNGIYFYKLLDISDFFTDKLQQGGLLKVHIEVCRDSLRTVQFTSLWVE